MQADRIRLTSARLALIVLAAFAGACPRPVGPERAVANWLTAVAQDDADGAWSLLSRAARADNERDAVGARARTTDDAALRGALDAAGGAEVAAVEARWPLAGRPLVVALRDGRWVLREGVLGLYPCDTPAASLRSFLAAWGRERWDVVWRLAPRRAREQFTPEALAERFAEPVARELVDERARRLEEALALGVAAETAPIAGDGSTDQVTVPYGPFRASLVHQDGCWRIEDL